MLQHEKEKFDNLEGLLKEYSKVQYCLDSELFANSVNLFAGKANAIHICSLDELTEVLLMFKEMNFMNEKISIEFDADTVSKANTKLMNAVMLNFRTATPEKIEAWQNGAFVTARMFFSVQKMAWCIQVEAKLKNKRENSLKTTFTNNIWVKFKIRKKDRVPLGTEDFLKVMTPALKSINVDEAQAKLWALEEKIKALTLKNEVLEMQNNAFKEAKLELKENIEEIIEETIEETSFEPIITEEQKIVEEQLVKEAFIAEDAKKIEVVVEEKQQDKEEKQQQALISHVEKTLKDLGESAISYEKLLVMWLKTKTRESFFKAVRELKDLDDDELV